VIIKEMNELVNEFVYILKASWSDDSEELLRFKNLISQMDNMTVYEVLAKNSCESIYEGLEQKEIDNDVIAVYPKLIPVLTILERLVNTNDLVTEWLEDYINAVVVNTDDVITSVYNKCENKSKLLTLLFLYLNKKTIYSNLYFFPKTSKI